MDSKEEENSYRQSRELNGRREIIDTSRVGKRFATLGFGHCSHGGEELNVSGLGRGGRKLEVENEIVVLSLLPLLNVRVREVSKRDPLV